MTKEQKIEEAKACVAEAEKNGSVATIEGNWVCWRPPVSVPLMMRLGKVITEVGDIIRARETAK